MEQIAMQFSDSKVHLYYVVSWMLALIVIVSPCNNGFELTLSVNSIKSVNDDLSSSGIMDIFAMNALTMFLLLYKHV